MMNGFEGHSWGMGMGWWWIIGLIIIVVVVWMLVKGLNQNNQSTNQRTGKTALDILKERYARGEIDKQKFEEQKKDLL
ncbi:SHOCT domain-containing protein [Sunxiuqinia indica]|uniref:SHOCT domain-containing protein n=1 Tax=Sunxiuqinia indica TaxID=2692584 RepID=UPI00135C240E|nr:SHOCT domain-containing protein [Sunxiuqinia indica]